MLKFLKNVSKYLNNSRGLIQESLNGKGTQLSLVLFLFKSPDIKSPNDLFSLNMDIFKQYEEKSG